MTPHEEGNAWLERLTPAEWLKAGVGELERAERALAARDMARGVAGLKRAAGMACNAALRVVPNPSWGQSYVEHLSALSHDELAPEVVQSSAALLAELSPGRGPIVPLTTGTQHEAWLEAARTVMAHAYAIVYGSAGRLR